MSAGGTGGRDCEITLKDHGEHLRCMRTGGKLMSLQSLQRAGRRTEETTVSVSPLSLCRDIISKQVEEKVIRSSQHRFTKGNSCLSSLVDLEDVMTGWVDEARAMDVVYLDFIKTFAAVSYNILIGELRKCRLNVWTVRWIVNWLASSEDCDQ